MVHQLPQPPRGGHLKTASDLYNAVLEQAQKERARAKREDSIQRLIDRLEQASK
jgi:hypothetical protein